MKILIKVRVTEPSGRDNPRTVVLKLWFLGQQHQTYLETFRKANSWHSKPPKSETLCVCWGKGGDGDSHNPF